MREATRQLTNDPIVLRIIELLKIRGKTDKELGDNLRLAHGTVSAWKYGGSKSYRPHINEIAEFLEVSPNYLLRGIDKEVNVATLSESEIKLIKGFRNADSNGKRHIIETVKYVEHFMK